MISRACSRNFCSPSFKLIEFTIHLPWAERRPPSITDHLELSPSIFKGSRPLRRVAGVTFGILRGRILLNLSLIAHICSGVVPQQPPTMFKNPLRAKSSSKLEVISGVSSYPVSLKGLGRPALG